jgi:hypothetical protein
MIDAEIADAIQRIYEQGPDPDPDATFIATQHGVVSLSHVSGCAACRYFLATERRIV